jgi:hypothetical protein
MCAPAQFPVLKGPICRQTVRAKQAGHFPLFNCPTITPHSSNRVSFKHFRLLPFFRRRLSFLGGRGTLKNFVLKCAHSKIFWRGVKYFGTNFLCVYILEVGVARGATMVGAERENFETFKSLDRRKWHFQSLVWPSASCRAQKESR